MSAYKCQWGCCDYHTDKAEMNEGSFTESTDDDSDPMFVCDNCGDEFSDVEEAVDCCTNWTCNYCGYASDNQHDATFCCHTSCYDCGEEGWPNDLEDHECSSDDEDGCGCCGGGSNSMGHSSNPPWVVRGDLEYTDPRAADARHPKGKWQQVWGFEPMHHDPVRAAGEYYILESILSGSVGASHEDVVLRRLMSDDTARKVLHNEAEEMMQAMVAEFMPVFRSYAHLAIGGELRHHVAIGGHILPSSRSAAWAGWKSIFEAVGPQALLDAAELFEEFGGGTYGGKPWADACRVLHAFETGKLSARVFLDRMFALQHNGGCFLNKVTWADKNEMGWDVHKLQHQLLPAHGAFPEPDYATLLSVCGKKVRDLFSDWWKVCRVRGVRPTPAQTSLSQWMPHVPKPLATQAEEWAGQAEYYANYAKQYANTPGYESYAQEYQEAAAGYWFKAATCKLELMVNGDPAALTTAQLKAQASAKKAAAYAAKVKAYRSQCNCWLHGGSKISNGDGWFNPSSPSDVSDEDDDNDF